MIFHILLLFVVVDIILHSSSPYASHDGDGVGLLIVRCFDFSRCSSIGRTKLAMGRSLCVPETKSPEQKNKKTAINDQSAQNAVNSDGIKCDWFAHFGESKEKEEKIEIQTNL